MSKTQNILSIRFSNSSCTKRSKQRVSILKSLNDKSKEMKQMVKTCGDDKRRTAVAFGQSFFAMANKNEKVNAIYSPII